MYIKDLIINESKLLQIMPLGDYMTHFIFYTVINKTDIYLGDQRAFAEIKAKRG